MNIDEIRKNKPEWATHYNPNNRKSIYYKICDGKIKFYVAKHDLWYGSCIPFDELDDELKPLY